MTLYRIGDLTPTTPGDGKYWISPGAHVMGQVEIGEDVGIWFGATIRGDNEPIIIGAGTNIQEKSTLHVDPGCPIVIGKGCTVGHNAILHGCTIGDNSLVGMGATVLNGARIGANCLIGANALVTEGKAFEDGSLIVGSPAKAIRKLDEKAIESIRRSADTYIARWKYYAENLIAL